MADPAADGLIHVADYQWVTKDTTTADVDVEQALDDALHSVEEWLGRKLAYGSHTETLYVYRDGKVYPSNTPIDTVTTPPVAATAIQGAGVYLGVFLLTPAFLNAGDWNAAVPPQSTLTYQGGYQPYGTTDGPTAQLPMRALRGICRVAWLALHPVVLAGVPVGAKSASVGDVSVTGDLTAFIDMDAGVQRDLRQYKKRKARGWQRA